MKPMLATIGICVAMAFAGCAQKADTNTNLAAFGDDAPAACCPSKAACSSKASAACCASKAKSGSECTKSKADGSGCPLSKGTTEAN